MLGCHKHPVLLKLKSAYQETYYVQRSSVETYQKESIPKILKFCTANLTNYQRFKNHTQ